MKRFFFLAAAAVACCCACNQSEVAVSSLNTDPAAWAPAGEHIRTRWAADVDPANAHPEYPRPQMVRADWKSLNGLWEYSITPKEQESWQGADGQILVPFAVESSLSGVGKTVTADESLWYRTTFTVPKNWKKKNIKINFDAVDWASEVYLNGSLVGRHTGGYTAFSYDLTPFLTQGEQELVVKVTDATDDNLQPRGKQVSEPRGIWYTAVTGIWQSVWLEPVSAASIADYQVSSDIKAGTITLNVAVCDSQSDDEVAVELLDGAEGYDTSLPSKKVIAKAAGAPGKDIIVKVDDVHTWSPDSPYLYGLKITLKRGRKTLDCVQAYTAMRSITADSDAAGFKRMKLNGEPLFQYGPLDQGWWPDGLYTAPTDEALLYDLQMTREYGFNMIRKHIKVEPSRWFYHCDRLGILVWQDMPSFAAHAGREDWDYSHGYDAGNDYPATAEAKANYYKEWKEIMNQVKKFQCVVVWVPFNEAWGQFDTKEAVDFTYRTDNTRLVNMSSGGNWVSGKVGDLLDSHHYPNPDINIWDPEMVVVLGEYGGIGLPVEGHLWNTDKNWGYVTLEDTDAVTSRYEQFAKEMIPFVKKGVSAAVYTQTTDVEGEVNGLMTYDRAVNKLDVKRVNAANTEVIKAMNSAE
ncbi:MAG: beta-galactosidase [Bacteroidales bacterium]|nr:beta-galactosidase [Candidatus Cryptobacteroides onthequi]